MAGAKGAECGHCSMTAEADFALHQHLKSSTPDLTFTAAAALALRANRRVLALKLATAAIRWEESPDSAWHTRILALSGMEFQDQAYEEAVRWVRREGSPVAFSALARVQVEMAAPQEAIRTLQYALTQSPEEPLLWAELAEHFYAVKDYPRALDAASRLIDKKIEKVLTKRALRVIQDAASGYYRHGQFDDAAAAAAIAGRYQERIADLAWIRAHVATFRPNDAETLRWAQVVLKLDPHHSDALALVARLTIQEKKRGWLW